MPNQRGAVADLGGQVPPLLRAATRGLALVRELLSGIELGIGAGDLSVYVGCVSFFGADMERKPPTQTHSNPLKNPNATHRTSKWYTEGGMWSTEALAIWNTSPSRARTRASARSCNRRRSTAATAVRFGWLSGWLVDE